VLNEMRISYTRQLTNNLTSLASDKIESFVQIRSHKGCWIDYFLVVICLAIDLY
jgi:hypothetical protein